MQAIDLDHLSQALVAKALRFGDSLALAAIVFIAMLAIGAVVATLLHGVARRQPRHASLLTILARAAWIAGLILAILSALQNLGVNVSALVASLGLAGLTLGFALRDVVSSFIAGVLIIAYRPFAPGDHITVQGVAGRVVAIDLRYTRLVAEGCVHLVPNSTILANPVTVAIEPPPPADKNL